ncbi:MAG: prolyl oligopeptidase family serine peptidase [Pseudomonadota bacterium]
MSSKVHAPAGSWPSPITTDMVVAGSRRLAEPRVHGASVLWLEGRPEDHGRVVLVREIDGGERIDLVPKPFSVRSRAHEYGGGAYTIGKDEAFFVNAEDQRVYAVSLDGRKTPRAITDSSTRRFADLNFDARHHRLLAVSENHAGKNEPVTTLVAIDLDTGELTTLANGADFYSSPALSPDGSALAWLSWQHPDMPWDATTLWYSDLSDNGELMGIRRVGHDRASHFQPQFSPDGTLYVVSDHSDWWNLYRLDAAGGELVPVAPAQREFAFPQWVFGMSTYGFLDADTIAAVSTAGGTWVLHTINVNTGETVPVAPFDFSACEQLHAADGRAVLIAGGPRTPYCITSAVVEHGENAAKWTRHQRASELSVDDDSLSEPVALTIRAGRAHECHGFYYPPTSATHALGDNERPPLLLKCHGGPTSATDNVFDPRIQYWTSRGIAVFDLNYRGSTGYGRGYRRALWDRWGISDVEDCRHVVEELAARGLADPDRALISGGSAGGYTVLCALTFDDVFAAGASYYGIGDLELLARDTHKFESRYLDRMVGPYPAARDHYRARSPLHHVDRLACPVIFFQGLEDGVVPPNQAETMVSALREKGVTVAYVPFAGEGHGFRQSDNIRFALAAELAFYGRVLGFTPNGISPDLSSYLG